MQNYMKYVTFTGTVLIGVIIGSGVMIQQYESRIDKLDRDVDALEYQLPKLKEENVVGGPEKDAFIQFPDGTRFYYSIDGRLVENYLPR